MVSLPSWMQGKRKEKGPRSMWKFHYMQEIWQDREIRFDVSRPQLKTSNGEFEIDSINSVEDTKGNNGKRGFLVVTNLRLIWAQHKHPTTNLSIGFNCITSINIKTVRSKLRGNVQGLYVMTKVPKPKSGNSKKIKFTRFEFIFTSLVRKSPRLFTTVQAVVRCKCLFVIFSGFAVFSKKPFSLTLPICLFVSLFCEYYPAYETTKLYRELKLRAAIIRDRQLLLLPKEQVYNKVEGVWNLSSDQGNLGTFFITNVRLVWHANLAENFNVTIPYLQMASVRVRGSKFGPALVVETRASTGGYLLGFRVDPHERLDEVFETLATLYKVYAENPMFGIEHTIESSPHTLDSLKVERKEDKVEIVDDSTMGSEAAVTSYIASNTGTSDQAKDDTIIFDSHLGLAAEALPADFTCRDLWSIF